jgi:hypothetical protein
MATSMLMAGTFAWFAMRGGRSFSGRMLRLPFAVAFALVGLALSQPLGPIIQSKVTTDAEMGSLQLLSVSPTMEGRVQAHRVRTSSRSSLGESRLSVAS